MTFEGWIIYTMTIFTATILPGPSMFLALHHGIKYGQARTIATALGVTTAAWIMATISVLGLGAIMMASGPAFQIIKYLGAGYLVYLGIKNWRDHDEDNRPSAPKMKTRKKSLLRMFIQALMVGLSNPKAIIFFTALFPQFIHHADYPLSQYFIMMLTLWVVVFICMMLYAMGGGYIAPFFNRSWAVKTLNRICGTVFIAFGLGLVITDQR